MSKKIESETYYYRTFPYPYILALVETLHDITEILNFRNELASVDTVEDFLRATGEEGVRSIGR
jgi:hypothetical protein